MAVLKITKGSTFRDVLRWGSGETVFKRGTLAASAPITVTCTGHGLVDGWPIQVEEHPNISATKYHLVSVVNSGTFILPKLNGTSYKSGIYTLRWAAPVDLTGYTARMQIKDKVGGTVICTPTITLNNTAKTITREISAATTAALTAKRGVYDLEMVNGDYVVKIDSGTVVIADEVTT